MRIHLHIVASWHKIDVCMLYLRNVALFYLLTCELLVKAVQTNRIHILIILKKKVSHSNHLSNFLTCRRIVQPWLGLRVASVRAKKMSIREEIHNRFPFSYGIYVDKVIFALCI